MLSKQRVRNLFNDQYNRSTNKKRAGIDNLSNYSANVKIESIRIKNTKYFKIELPVNNPIDKPFIKLNLNTIRRPNYENGSLEMYRSVNGLCHYCGHSTYTAKITLSKVGYNLSDIYCTKCQHKQPLEYVHTYTNKNQKNRGKDYADRQRENNKKPNSNLNTKNKNR